MFNTSFIRSVSLNRHLVHDFDEFPFKLPIMRHLHDIELHPKATFFVGENGSGKSTLLEAIAIAQGFNPEGGSKNFNFHTRSSHSELHKYIRIAKGIKRPRDGFFLRAESFYNVATEIEELDQEDGSSPRLIGSYGGKSLHEQSHGESFLSLLMNRFGEQGLYLLDEPEAALSPQNQLCALSRIHDLIQGNSQFIIATHSPILLAYPDAWIYECSEHGLTRVNYFETAHYQLTHVFLANPQRMLDILLKT